MAKNRALYLALVALSLTLLLGATEEGGCGEGLNNRVGEPGIDVGGPFGATWDLDYSQTLEIQVLKGGAVVDTASYAAATGGDIDVDGVTVNTAKLCSREDVACPQEVFPRSVRMTQPGTKLHLLYTTFNKEGPLGEINDTTLVGNVDSDFDFSIFLGVGGAGAGPCALLSASYATGAIESDGGAPPKGIKMTGHIVTEYAGGCVASGSAGTVAAGVTVRLKIPFIATRR